PIARPAVAIAPPPGTAIDSAKLAAVATICGPSHTAHARPLGTTARWRATPVGSSSTSAPNVDIAASRNAATSSSVIARTSIIVRPSVRSGHGGEGRGRADPDELLVFADHEPTESRLHRDPCTRDRRHG